MSMIEEEILEHHGFKKHTVYTKPDPRGAEYGMLEITLDEWSMSTHPGVYITVRPHYGDRYTLVFPTFTDFRHWLEHQL